MGRSATESGRTAPALDSVMGRWFGLGDDVPPGVSSVTGSHGQSAAHETSDSRSPLALWRRRLVADQALEKVDSIIRIRQYELGCVVEERELLQGDSRAPELPARLERARALIDERPNPNDRVSSNELLDRLDGILPLVADDDRLRLMLESELDRSDTGFSDAQRQRARQLLDQQVVSPPPAAYRRQLEVLLASAVRERNDRLREERIAGELRQNYLTWLGLVLLLLLVAVFAVAVLASSHGLWADILLAILAGALGGSLSGLLRLRPPQARLGALKNLGLVLLVQPLLGAVGGTILFAIWRSGLLDIAGLHEADWASVASVAFVGGFSERFFLRSLARITGSEEQASDNGSTQASKSAQAG